MTKPTKRKRSESEVAEERVQVFAVMLREGNRPADGALRAAG